MPKEKHPNIYTQAMIVGFLSAQFSSEVQTKEQWAESKSTEPIYTQYLYTQVGFICEKVIAKFNPKNQ